MYIECTTTVRLKANEGLCCCKHPMNCKHMLGAWSNPHSVSLFRAKMSQMWCSRVNTFEYWKVLAQVSCTFFLAQGWCNAQSLFLDFKGLFISFSLFKDYMKAQWPFFSFTRCDRFNLCYYLANRFYGPGRKSVCSLSGCTNGLSYELLSKTLSCILLTKI